jgi:hypothetical protein
MKRVWFAWALLALAFAGRASAAQGSFDVRLIEPEEHLDVVAGASIPIVWDAGKAPIGVDEWEAFVSVDGGQTYPIRITPHLSVSIHRFNWVVPSLPGAEVSILLRFGDEHEEREFPFSARMRIAGAPPLGTFRHEPLRETAFRRSSPEDDHGQQLVDWVDGSRDGADLRHVVVDETWIAEAQARSRQHGTDSAPAIGTNAPRAGYAPGASVARADDGLRSRTEYPPLSRGGAGLLLLTGRLNI